MGKGSDDFDFFSFGGRQLHYTYRGIRQIDNTNQLLVKVAYHGRGEQPIIYDTALIYRDSSFIEYVAQPTTHSISQINYEFGGGWGAEWYTVSIDSTHPDYWRMSTLLNGIRFTELSSQYEDGMSDMTFSTLVIYYDNGKGKKIHDYGHIGPLGLRYVNKQLDAIHERKKR